MTEKSTILVTVTIETLASKWMLKISWVILPVRVINRKLLVTYSEAMLISGASKQISCAILDIFRFINLLNISSMLVLFIHQKITSRSSMRFEKRLFFANLDDLELTWAWPCKRVSVKKLWWPTVQHFYNDVISKNSIWPSKKLLLTAGISRCHRKCGKTDANGPMSTNK